MRCRVLIGDKYWSTCLCSSIKASSVPYHLIELPINKETPTRHESGFVLVRKRSSSGSPERLFSSPSSAGGHSSFEQRSQSTEERATLDCYHHFQGHSDMCA